MTGNRASLKKTFLSPFIRDVKKRNPGGMLVLDDASGKAISYETRYESGNKKIFFDTSENKESFYPDLAGAEPETITVYDGHTVKIEHFVFADKIENNHVMRDYSTKPFRAGIDFYENGRMVKSEKYDCEGKIKVTSLFNENGKEMTREIPGEKERTVLTATAWDANGRMTKGKAAVIQTTECDFAVNGWGGVELYDPTKRPGTILSRQCVC